MLGFIRSQWLSTAHIIDSHFSNVHCAPNHGSFTEGFNNEEWALFPRIGKPVGYQRETNENLRGSANNLIEMRINTYLCWIHSVIFSIPIHRCYKSIGFVLHFIHLQRLGSRIRFVDDIYRVRNKRRFALERRCYDITKAIHWNILTGIRLDKK